jgi:hypothetical protein
MLGSLLSALLVHLAWHLGPKEEVIEDILWCHELLVVPTATPELMLEGTASTAAASTSLFLLLVAGFAAAAVVDGALVPI